MNRVVVLVALVVVSVGLALDVLEQVGPAPHEEGVQVIGVAPILYSLLLKIIHI